MRKQRDRVTASEARADAKAPGFLRRLRKDTAGNTLAIIGAALVPLAGMIGSGVDLSRAYMAKTRMQSACDAGSLAARRVLTADTMTDAVSAEGTKFFNFNFPQGLYDTAAFTPEFTKPDAGVIRVEASTTMPTVVMKLFGFETLPLNVSCEASQNFVNTDIVLVLDVTLSMNCTPSETQPYCRENEITNSRLPALRSAVMALYDELAPVQEELEEAGMRLRYGIVPFSSNVNVGKEIYAEDHGYIVSNWTYQSRTFAYYDQITYERTYSNLNSSECAAYNVARSPGSGFPATETTTERPGTGNRRNCIVRRHNYNQTGQGTAQWMHDARALDTSTYKTGVATPTPTRAPGVPETTGQSTWAGCVEERDTVDTITASSGWNIPSGAKDLDIDAIPDSDATRWRPSWPEVMYARDTEAGKIYAASDSDGQALKQSGVLGTLPVACPKEAARLKAFTRQDMLDYVTALRANGYTYHDIGMIWGARLISAAGVFGDSPDEYNEMPVSKHIIYMTDGVISPNATGYTAYGVERLDQRVTGAFNTPNHEARHKQRFRMICNAVKGKNVSVWVIAFSTTADSSMSECASSSSQFANVNSSQALIDKFKEIGKNIGALRLTQ